MENKMSLRDTWLTLAEVREVCPPCAKKMELVGMKKIRASQIQQKMKEQKTSEIENLIKSAHFSQQGINKIKASLRKCL